MLMLGPRIFAVIDAGPRFRSYEDNWVEGRDPDVPAGTPPAPGLYTPWRGFGKVWSEDPTLPEAIGWATESQARPDRIDYQLFDSGIFLLHLQSTGKVYAFGNPDNPGEVQIFR